MRREAFIYVGMAALLGYGTCALLQDGSTPQGPTSPLKEFVSFGDVPLENFYRELKGIKPKASDRLTIPGLNLIWANYSTSTFHPEAAQAVYQTWQSIAEQNLHVNVRLGGNLIEVALKRAPYKQGVLFILDQSQPQPSWDKDGYWGGTDYQLPEGVRSYIRVPDRDGEYNGLNFRKRSTNALLHLAVEACHEVFIPQALGRMLSESEQLIAREIVGNSYGQALAYAFDGAPYPFYSGEVELKSKAGNYKINPKTPIELFILVEKDYNYLRLSTLKSVFS